MKLHSELFRTEVGAAIERRGMTVNAAAQVVGVSHVTLRSWLTGRSTPDVDYLPELSKITDIPLWRLHYLAGYLPENYSPAVAMDQAWRRQVELYKAMRVWAGNMIDEVGITPVGRAVSLLTQWDEALIITVRPNLKGVMHPIAPNTQILVNSTRGLSADDLKNEITDSLGYELAMSGIGWCMRSLEHWNVDTEAILDVPEFERFREAVVLEPRGKLANNIVVMGVPYVHAELFGALIAEATGYGFENPQVATLRHHDRVGELSPQDIGDHSRRRIYDLLRSADRRAYHRVFAMTYPPTIISRQSIDSEFSFDEAETSDVDFVYIKINADQVRLAGEIWPISREHVDQFEHWLDRISESLGSRCVTLELDFDGSDTGRTVERELYNVDDQIVDAIVEIAVRYLEVKSIDQKEMETGVLYNSFGDTT